jgi:cysteine desulfurase
MSSGKVKTKTNAKVSPVIYLDNNGTTLICDDAAKEYAARLKCYNPAADSASAKSAQSMIKKAKKYVQTLCNADKYEVIFTSGASESNCYILRSTVSSYARILKAKPHLVVSAIEHHSILECCHSLELCKTAEVTYVQPNIYGVISPESVSAAIKKNTCLVSIMYANNEIGSVNNIPAISKVVRGRKVAFHSDCVQMFGRYRLNLEKTGLDAISASFHKLYGPKGIGLLLIKKTFIKGYDLQGLINGSQQNGLRGGTENMPAIASAYSAMKWNFRNRQVKNKKLQAMCDNTIATLSKHIKQGEYKLYTSSANTPVMDLPPFEMVVLGPDRSKKGYRIPNTLLIAFVKNTGKAFCNVNFKKALEKEGIIVSISSACLTSSTNASHVLTAIGASKSIKTGVIRVSFSDYNSQRDVVRFCAACVRILKKQKIQL